MKTDLHDAKGVSDVSAVTGGDSNIIAGSETVSENIIADQAKKKYHTSALYAASMWHNPVQYVRPYHTGIKS